MTRQEQINKEARMYADNSDSGIIEFISDEMGFREGAEWADKTMIDKAWDWILRYFVCTSPLEFQKEMEKAFRKEMEE